MESQRQVYSVQLYSSDEEMEWHNSFRARRQTAQAQSIHSIAMGLQYTDAGCREYCWQSTLSAASAGPLKAFRESVEGFWKYAVATSHLTSTEAR